MTVVARAPGKLAVLGEYAVLGGAPALVFAVDRYCRARIGPRTGLCRLETRLPEPRRVETQLGQPTGVALVDLVCAAVGRGDARPWEAELDSSELFAGGHKLGLGSSAAALCAWAGAWAAWTSAGERPQLDFLIDLHRRFQGGAGSGFDVAAALTGGAVVFRLDSGSEGRPDEGIAGRSAYRVGSVRLPNSVAFAGIFAGRSASTTDLVSRFHRWRAEKPNESAERQRVMEQIAGDGCDAVQRADVDDFLCAVAAYGRQLYVLGSEIGADIVTAEHRAIADAARRFGVTYKVSGAGGGDLGIALSADRDALSDFEQAVAGQGFEVVDLHLDQQGLVVEELG